MNYAQKLCLSMATVISFSGFGMMQQVVRDDTGFKIFDGKQVRPVQSCFVDPLLKRMNPEQLTKFVEQGNRIKAIRLSDGEHRLQAMVPGKGGGPVTAMALYWITKSLCWGAVGTAVAAGTATVVTAVAATGGAAGVAVGAAINAGTAAAVATTGAGTVGATVAAAALGTTAATTAATTTAVGSVVAATGTVAGFVAAIEGVSAAACAFGLALPLP